MRTIVITVQDSKLAEQICDYMKHNCRDSAGKIDKDDWYVEYDGTFTSVCVNKVLTPNNDHFFRAVAHAYRRAVEDTLNGLLKEVSVRLPFLR